jgi:hypothetical protein
MYYSPLNFETFSKLGKNVHAFEILLNSFPSEPAIQQSISSGEGDIVRLTRQSFSTLRAFKQFKAPLVFLILLIALDFFGVFKT